MYISIPYICHPRTYACIYNVSNNNPSPPPKKPSPYLFESLVFLCFFLCTGGNDVRTLMHQEDMRRVCVHACVRQKGRTKWYFTHSIVGRSVTSWKEMDQRFIGLTWSPSAAPLTDVTRPPFFVLHLSYFPISLTDQSSFHIPKKRSILRFVRKALPGFREKTSSKPRVETCLALGKGKVRLICHRLKAVRPKEWS